MSVNKIVWAVLCGAGAVAIAWAQHTTGTVSDTVTRVAVVESKITTLADKLDSMDMKNEKHQEKVDDKLERILAEVRRR